MTPIPEGLQDDAEIIRAAYSHCDVIALGESLDNILAEVERLQQANAGMVGALRTVQMLRSLGGMMPGAREVVMVAVESADAAIAAAAEGSHGP